MRDMKVAALHIFAENYDLSINWLKLDSEDFSPVSFYNCNEYRNYRNIENRRNHTSVLSGYKYHFLRKSSSLF